MRHFRNSQPSKEKSQLFLAGKFCHLKLFLVLWFKKGMSNGGMKEMLMPWHLKADILISLVSSVSYQFP